MMKPILFNAEMVRAILDGRKTVTRRVVKPHQLRVLDSPYHKEHPEVQGKILLKKLCEPPYRHGDTLYVRETWKQATTGTAGSGLTDLYLYKADEPLVTAEMMAEDRWHPSIHMPKSAARIFLKVTGVGVERLQDMTEDDAFKEGFNGIPWCFHPVLENYPDTPIPCDASDGSECPPDIPCDRSIPELFGEMIWDRTIKPADRDRYGWEANPWVWVIGFERISKEDAHG